jgi:hypothetical protein
MDKANVNDRQSVSALYPRTAFEEDAAHNAVGNTGVVHGVQIESQPDGGGWFRLVRVRHHVAEVTAPAETLFLAPSEPGIAGSLVGADPADGAPAASDGDPAARLREYEAFIDRVLDAARKADFQDPIGRDEERLRGFRGG